jgi:hypothetical protein
VSRDAIAFLKAMTLSPEINEKESMRDVWFTADFHFGHFNIIR